MPLDILCTPDFNEEELALIDQLAAMLGIRREEVVRKAVKYFAAQCVPVALPRALAQAPLHTRPFWRGWLVVFPPRLAAGKDRPS